MSLAADPSTGELLTPTFEWPAGVHPAADLFPMMDPLSFSELVEDIRVNGQADPIVLMPDDRLLDGRNRLAACQSIGRKPEVRVYAGDDPTGHVISLNVHRRHLTITQLGCIAAEALPLFEAEAKDRQRLAGGDKVSSTARALCAPVHTPVVEPRPRRAADEAGAKVGVGGRTVWSAAKVKDEAPDLFDKLKAGEMTAKAAERVLNERKREQVNPIPKKGKQEPAAAKSSRFHKIDHNKVVERTVESLRAMPVALAAIPVDATFDESRAAEWVTDLTRVIGCLNRLKSRLKEQAR